MKPDTTEARRLADELAADVAVLLREGLPQEAMRADKAQAAMRALADENERMRAELDALRKGHHLTLASPELAGNIARLKKRMADDPQFARGLLTSAGICNEDGSLTERYGGGANG